MKHGQKPAEPRMEDVLASIRRAIDESAHGQPPERLGGSMAELRVKFDPPANQDRSSSRRSYDRTASTAASRPQGFAGILAGKRSYGEASPRETFRPLSPPPQRPDPVTLESDGEGQQVYDGYYGAQLEDYPEPVPEPYEAPPVASPPRYLPPPPAMIADHRQGYPQHEGLMSEASSEATQAAFGRLAETLTRRALGERSVADVTHEMLRSMLKQWLDENLPTIVERLVREEIERVVRRPAR